MRMTSSARRDTSAVSVARPAPAPALSCTLMSTWARPDDRSSSTTAGSSTPAATAASTVGYLWLDATCAEAGANELRSAPTTPTASANNPRLWVPLGTPPSVRPCSAAHDHRQDLADRLPQDRISQMVHIC